MPSRSLMVFLLVSPCWLDGLSLVGRHPSLTPAFLVETSQLYRAPWIDAIRQVT